jgi:hypothetical protein
MQMALRSDLLTQVYLPRVKVHQRAGAAVLETLFGTYVFKFKRGESNKPVLALFQMTAEGEKEEF